MSLYLKPVILEKKGEKEGERRGGAKKATLYVYKYAYSEKKDPKKPYEYWGIPENYDTLIEVYTAICRSDVPIFPAICPNCASPKLTVVLGTATKLECLDCGKRFKIVEEVEKNAQKG